jgi:Domain of unknown function (DUF6316)
MQSNRTAQASRFEGRLFSDGGRLHFVLRVDPDSGFARVSCHATAGRQVFLMPITEVAERLSSTLHLDGLNTAETSRRIFEQTDGWFFSTREGPNGPFQSRAEANAALRRYIVSTQGHAA